MVELPSIVGIPLECWLLQQGVAPAAHTDPAWLASGHNAKSICSSCRRAPVENCRCCVLPCNALCDLKSGDTGKAADDDKPGAGKDRLHKPVSISRVPASLLGPVPLSLGICPGSCPLALHWGDGVGRSGRVAHGRRWALESEVGFLSQRGQLRTPF